MCQFRCSVYQQEKREKKRKRRNLLTRHSFVRLKWWAGQDWKLEIATWRFTSSTSLFVEWTGGGVVGTQRKNGNFNGNPRQTVTLFHSRRLQLLVAVGAAPRRNLLSGNQKERVSSCLFCCSFTHPNYGNEKCWSRMARRSETIYRLRLVHDTADRNCWQFRKMIVNIAVLVSYLDQGRTRASTAKNFPFYICSRFFSTATQFLVYSFYLFTPHCLCVTLKL